MSEAVKVIFPTPMCKGIAVHMTETKRTIPHFRLCADIELEALIGLRQVLRNRHADMNLSLNDLLIKARATALMDATAVNILSGERGLHQYLIADIPVAIALEGGGLSTPVIRRADSESIWEIAREVKDLLNSGEERAQSGILRGSFSLSNLGLPLNIGNDDTGAIGRKALGDGCSDPGRAADSRRCAVTDGTR